MGFAQFRQTRNVYRQGDGSYVDGYWTETTAESTFTIEASMQPASDKIRKNPPEGYDVDALLEMGTESEMITAERGGTKKADQVEYEGQRYCVIRLERWQNTIIPHRWYVIGLIDNE